MLSTPRPRPSLPHDPKKVLFVCTGNSCRSVMAEGVFRKLASDRGLEIEAGSAGTSTFAGIGASEETIRVMKEQGIDVTHHRGRKVSADLVRGADIIFVMHQNHKDFLLSEYPEVSHKTFLLSQFYGGDDHQHFAYGIPDPIGMSGHFYRNVLGVIRNSVEGVIDEIRGGGARPAA